MSTKVSLDLRGERIFKYQIKLHEHKKEARHYRLRIGAELYAAYLDIEADKSGPPWEDWCAQNIALSQRQIDSFIAMATRVRSRGRISLWAAHLHQAYDEGMSAYLKGLPQARCPYHSRRHAAAWYLGWRDMEIRQRTENNLLGATKLAHPSQTAKALKYRESRTIH